MASIMCQSVAYEAGSGSTPRVENFRANSVLRADTICSKILNVKSMFNAEKNFRANSVFQGKRKLLKNPERSKIFQHSEKVQDNSVFQGKRKLFKILNDKKS